MSTVTHSESINEKFEGIPLRYLREAAHFAPDPADNGQIYRLARHICEVMESPRILSNPPRMVVIRWNTLTHERKAEEKRFARQCAEAAQRYIAIHGGFDVSK